MSKQPIRGVDAARVDEDSVAEYLELNPDFFERHAGLLTKLKLSHQRGAATVSLIERQVFALREKNQNLEGRLRELIEVARSNDVLAAKIHRLACRLIRARDAATALDSLEVSLREDFGASEWLIVLGSDYEAKFGNISSRHLRIVPSKITDLKMFETLFESGRPRCGQIRDSQRDFLFGENNVEIGSAALVPLGSQPHFGLLAIGSPDAERFHPAMSTEFLARIGDLVSEAIAAV
mgnify:CR=1 FL=1|jgi:uncharacterized protein YigA (DUF484 family)